MCKKFMYLFLFVTFAFSTMAMASEIAISTQANWWTQAAADAEMQEIVDNVTAVSVERFTAGQHAALATWVTNHTGNGQPDLLILCGIFPATIYPAGNAQPEGSLAELFLDDGNIIINTGDYMFYVGSAGNNDAGGLENMMDIPGITMWDDNTSVVVTADGQTYTPSLGNFQTDRPFHLDELTNNWSSELVLAQNGAGTRADPVIVINSVTGGRLGIFYQTAGEDANPRGEVISEWINNWYLAFVADTTKARSPDPSHGAIDVPMDANLGWIRGDGTVQDDVYFGTDPCALPKVTTIMNLPAFPPLYDPPVDLVASTTYYWRIDEVNGINIVTGDLWEFTTVRGEAQPDYPFDGAVIVGDTAGANIWTKLIFIPGPTAASHVGYFSDDYSKVESRDPTAYLGPPPYAGTPGWEYTLFAGNPSVPPATDTLVRGTKYYWTVDANDALNNEFYGDVWEFAIQGYKAFAPSPPNEAVMIS
ncbi:MAG: hypothetical protein ACYSU5_12180, partial [Planctomycetota bacterium]